MGTSINYSLLSPPSPPCITIWGMFMHKSRAKWLFYYSLSLCQDLVHVPGRGEGTLYIVNYTGKKNIIILSLIHWPYFG